MSSASLLTIGRFARACRLSIKALRIYDELGLLPPARIVHRGPYEELALAQHAVLAWIQERGLTPIGAMREIYLDDPKHFAPEKVRTEIGIPIAD
jgi:PPM family protein phosphatase